MRKVLGPQCLPPHNTMATHPTGIYLLCYVVRIHGLGWARRIAVMWKIKLDPCFHRAYKLILSRGRLLLFQDAKNENDPFAAKNKYCKWYSKILYFSLGLLIPKWQVFVQLSFTERNKCSPEGWMASDFD